VALGCCRRYIRGTVLPVPIPTHLLRYRLERCGVAKDGLRYLSSTSSPADRARKAALERAAARRTAGLTPPRNHGFPPPSSIPSQLNDAMTTTDRKRGESGVDVAAHELFVSSAGRELVLSPPALVVTREYEWGNIVFGFEQANRYTIRAAPGGEIVGFIAEEDSIGKSITRNILRTHRSFKATVLDKNGEPVFVIRRPFYVFATSLFIDEPGEDGGTLGFVKMSWHLWRRRYGLYTDQKQFAEIDSGFLAVDFEVRNEDGRRIASVNKDFTGFAREIFTDARQYVLRLDPSFNMTAEGIVNDPATVSAGSDALDGGDNMHLDLKQRAVLLASAISIDFDYFSLHSRGGLGPGGMFMPMPIPGTGAGAAGATGGVEGEGAGDNGEGAVGNSMGHGQSASMDGGDIGVGTGSTDVPGASSSSSEWATFEQPDYGFKDDPSASGDSDPWSTGSDSSDGGLFGSDGSGGALGGGDDSEGGGNLIISIIRRIFWNDD
jgi:hypothetical protein